MSNVKEEHDASSVAQEIKGLREQLEKNHKLAQAVEEEPSKVVIKSYIQGEPIDLINVTSSMFKSLQPKKQGEQSSRYALTIMVEEISKK